MMFKNKTRAVISLFCALSVGQVGATHAQEVLRHGDVAITQDMVRNYIKNTFPEAAQGNVYTNENRIQDIVFGMFVTRKLAEGAKQRTLSAQESMQLEEAVAKVLSQIQIQYLYDKAAKPDFDKLAQETFQVNKEHYKTGEQVRVEHILVATEKRTDEDARKRAEMVLEKVKAGATAFGDLALEYSDDPSATSNKGDLGLFAKGKMVKPFEEAAFALKNPGDIAGPIKTKFGYHIIRFMARDPGGYKTFDAVKQQLLQDEKNSFRKDVVDQEINRLKNLEGVKLDMDALKALVVKPNFSRPSSSR